jgi:L-fuculose-phosphate aldolase
MPDEGQLRRDLCEVGRRLWMQGLVAATDGNFSVRLTGEHLLATPTGVSKGFMSPDQIVKIDLTGQPIEGFTRPSSEIRMHLAIYAARSDVCGIVHGHPPTATGFAAARQTVPTEILTEAACFLGPVAVAGYATPGTDELAETLAPHMRGHNLFLLANHGAVAVGRDLLEACYRMESLEQCAKIAVVARQVGGAQAIAPCELERLRQIRQDLGFAPTCRSCLAASGGGGCSAGSRGQTPKETSPADEEVLVERITDLVLQALEGQV